MRYRTSCFDAKVDPTRNEIDAITQPGNTASMSLKDIEADESFQRNMRKKMPARIMLSQDRE
jgi:hypothetical protein